MRTQRLRLVLLTLVAPPILLLLGCDKSGSPKISVSITNKPSSVAAGNSTTLNATVANDNANAGVSWTISPSSGSGTLSQATPTSVLYTAPATPPSNPSVTVIATSITDSSASDSASFSIAAKPAISVSITNKISTIAAGASAVNLDATVSNDSSSAGVTWSLSANGSSCSPACGTLTNSTTSSVTYTPPATLPAAPNNSPVVTATSVTDSTKSDTDAITIQAAAQPIAVTISNKFASVAASSAQISLTASVANDSSNAGVTWSLTVSGTSCSPACGTLASPTSTSVVYSPPATVPANPSATITATSVTDTSKSDSFNFTITMANSALALLTGHYAAVLQGVDAHSNPRSVALSFDADGNGHITAGSVDLMEDFQAYHVAGPVTGTYTVDTSMQNAVLGQISFPGVTLPNFPQSPTSPAFALAFALTSDGKSGNVEERDSGLSVVSGKLFQQSPAAFSLSSIAGEYAFGAATGLNLSAPVETNWTAAAGRLTIATSGSFSNTLIDVSVAQSGPSVTNQAFTGSMTAPDSNGRGTFTMTPAGLSAMSFVYYVVSSSKWLFLQVDPQGSGNDINVGGTASRQALPFTAAALNGAAVFWANGQYGNVPVNASGAVGRFAFTNAASVDVQYDRSYQLSGHSESNTATNLPVTLDTATGRGTITFMNGHASLLFDSAVIYLYAPNAGYLLDATSGSGAEALSGTFVPQSTGPFGSSTLSGNLLALQGGALAQDPPRFLGVVSVTPPSGTYGYLDYYQDIHGATQIGTLFGDPKAFLTNVNSTSGRGTGNWDPTGNQCSNDPTCGAAFYLIDTNHAVLVNVPPPNQLVIGISSVLFLDPQ